MSDNIILVQEIIHMMVKESGPKGHIAMVRESRPKRHVALKLDLEKIYDRLEWSFIQETLEFFQIPSFVIQLYYEYAFFNSFSYYVELCSFTSYCPK